MMDPEKLFNFSSHSDERIEPEKLPSIREALAAISKINL
jgi:hypothetical protein